MNPLTVRAVLFGGDDPGETLGARLRGVGGPALAALSGAGRQAVDQEVGSALGGLLDLDVGQLLIGGWRRHRALNAAAQHTQANPTATELVQLAAHRVTTAHHPYVEIVLNGTSVATIHFDLNLAFDVDGVIATVRQARLMSLQNGHCTVTIGLGCEGHELASRQIPLDLATAVPLGAGIPLLQSDPTPPRPRTP